MNQKQTRPTVKKIPDIKALRSLTRLLGKLEVPSLHHTYVDESYRQYCIDRAIPMEQDKLYVKTYGYGLAESKAFVERWFDYQTPEQQVPTHMPYPRN
jgi:hypothetical protein